MNTLLLIAGVSAINTSDNVNTKDIVPDALNACNYQTKNNTLYHLDNINNADGGSGTQQLVV